MFVLHHSGNRWSYNERKPTALEIISGRHLKIAAPNVINIFSFFHIFFSFFSFLSLYHFL